MRPLTSIVRVMRSAAWPGAFEVFVGREPILEGDFQSCRSLAADIRRGLKPYVVPTKRRSHR